MLKNNWEREGRGETLIYSPLYLLFHEIVSKKIPLLKQFTTNKRYADVSLKPKSGPEKPPFQFNLLYREL